MAGLECTFDAAADERRAKQGEDGQISDNVEHEAYVTISKIGRVARLSQRLRPFSCSQFLVLIYLSGVPKIASPVRKGPLGVSYVRRLCQ